MVLMKKIHLIFLCKKELTWHLKIIKIIMLLLKFRLFQRWFMAEMSDTNLEKLNFLNLLKKYQQQKLEVNYLNNE